MPLTSLEVPASVDQNPNVNSSNAKQTNQVGYYPDETLPDPSSEYRENYTEVLEDLKTRIQNKNTSTRQNYLVIHGPVGTGKSTAARLLMTDTASDYVNRIWINAETSETLEQDFRQLYERMKALQYPVPGEREDFKELLICLYRNLLTEPTLIVFDNAAVVDIDSSSMFKLAFNLPTCLLALQRIFSTPGNTLQSPTIVITTRAAWGPTETYHFSLNCVKGRNWTDSIDDETVWKRVEADLQLVRNHFHGKLASFLFLLISLSGNENPPMPLLSYLCCRCPDTKVLLDSADPVREVDVRIGLKLLESFSMIETSTGSTVNLTKEIKKGSRKILGADTFLDLKSLVPPAIACTLSTDNEDTKLFFEMDLQEIDSWTNSLNTIILSLYPYLLENKVRPMEILTFDTFGNGAEAFHDLNAALIPSDLTESYSVELQSLASSNVEKMELVLGGFNNAAYLGSQQKNLFEVAAGSMWQGETKGVVEDVFAIFTPESDIYFKVIQNEYFVKVGKFFQAHMSTIRYNIWSRYEDFGISYHEPDGIIEAKCYTMDGKPTEAYELLQLFRKHWGRNSCATASIERALAKMDALNSDFKSALELIEHALAVRRQFLGVTTVRYIEAVATKTKILTLQGDYRKAQDCVSTAQKDFIAKKRYVYASGDIENHPHFLILRYHQAKLFYHQQLYSEAQAELEALQALFGETNVYWFKCQLLLAQTLQNIGNLSKSKALFKALIKQAEIVFLWSENHHVVKFKLAYAGNLVLQGNFKKAKEAAETVLQNASSHAISLRLRAKSILAQILKFETNMKAVPALKELVEESTNWCGPFHTQTLKFKLQLLEELIRIPNQQVSEIDDLINPVLQFLEAASYNSASKTLFSWHCLHASKLVQYNQLAEAEALNPEPLVNGKRVISVQLKYCNAILKSRQGHHHTVYTCLASELLHLATRPEVTLQEPDSAEVSAFLAFLVMKLERQYESPEAVNLCLSSLASIVRTHGSDHPRTMQAKLNLAIAYGVLGHCVTALELFEEVQSAFGNDWEANVLRDALSTASVDTQRLEYFIGGRITYSDPVSKK